MTATVYRSERYLVGGRPEHGGEVEVHYDPLPDGLTQVWDRDGDEWARDGDDWMPVGEHDLGGPWSWPELLDDFGPVTDVQEHGLRSECPHCLLELVDELHVAGHLP